MGEQAATGADPRAEPASLLAPLRERFDDVLARIEELVNIDSGSFTTKGVNRVADLCQARFEAGGWEVERHRHRPDRSGPGPPLGDMVVGRRAGGRPVAEGGRRLLLLAHMDTVFDEGTAAARPFRTRGGRAYGPGVTDDKAGVVCGFEAVEVLCDLAGFDDFAAITLVCSPDEEIGSPFSRPLIEALAGEHDVAVGLEAARIERRTGLGPQGHLGVHHRGRRARPCTPGSGPPRASTRSSRRPTRPSPSRP